MVFTKTTRQRGSQKTFNQIKERKGMITPDLPGQFFTWGNFCIIMSIHSSIKSPWMTISSAFSFEEAPQANFEPNILAVFFSSIWFKKFIKNFKIFPINLIRSKTGNMRNWLLFPSRNSSNFDLSWFSLLFGLRKDINCIICADRFLDFALNLILSWEFLKLIQVS